MVGALLNECGNDRGNECALVVVCTQVVNNIVTLVEVVVSVELEVAILSLSDGFWTHCLLIGGYGPMSLHGLQWMSSLGLVCNRLESSNYDGIVLFSIWHNQMSHRVLDRPGSCSVGRQAAS